MTYEDFQIRIIALLSKAEEGTSVRFSNNDGKLNAKFSDGVSISCPVGSLKMTVKWGGGHMAMATI